MMLVSWRYLWATTPLHRTEEASDTSDPPPELPAGLHRDGLILPRDGAGPLFHRTFRVSIRDAEMDAAELLATLTRDFGRFVPREVVGVHQMDADDRRLRQNDDLVVDMPGPWNGPVRVACVDPARLRLATLQGHLEAGQIEFRARDDDGRVVFEIEAWARPASRAVHLLYSHARLAKEIQLNMWVRFCRSAARISGGRIVGGIEVRTVRTPAAR
jgi:hypothetical protein